MHRQTGDLTPFYFDGLLFLIHASPAIHMESIEYSWTKWNQEKHMD